MAMGTNATVAGTIAIVTMDMRNYWEYDVDTYEEVNLLQQISAGRTAYDEEWNVITEHTIQALFGRSKGKSKGTHASCIHYLKCNYDCARKLFGVCFPIEKTVGRERK